jgi:formate hydrogenlyase subunit 3/multisubunit Na+/H+ antiporter MnhD subunit
MLLPVIILASGTILLGVFAQTFVDISFQAAEQLINPVDYIDKVLRR